jgi:hypothetical protein
MSNTVSRRWEPARENAQRHIAQSQVCAGEMDVALLVGAVAV